MDNTLHSCWRLIAYTGLGERWVGSPTGVTLATGRPGRVPRET
jgi:hypothetical protein